MVACPFHPYRSPLNGSRSRRRGRPIWIFLLVLTIVLSRASFAAAAEPAPPKPPAAVADYFPLVRGSQWIYAVTPGSGDLVMYSVYYNRLGKGHAGHKHHDHDAEEGRPDDEKPGLDHLVFDLFVSGTFHGRVQQVLIQKEWYRKDEAGNVLCARRVVGQEEVHIDPPQLVLPADPVARKTWTWSGVIGNETSRLDAAVEGEETIKVPAGEFKVLRVRVKSTVAGKSGHAVRWYARGVGLVKEEVEIAQKEGEPVRSHSELKSYRVGPLKGD